MRRFVVLVARPGRPPLGYPDLEGERALQCMETLAARGHAVIARTKANGIEEELTLPDMREIYA